jgi:transposase
MAAATKPQQELTLTSKEMDQILERAANAPLAPEDCQKLRALFETYAFITQLLENSKTTLKRLRQIIFGAKTEKTKDVLKNANGEKEPSSESSAKPEPSQPSCNSPAGAASPEPSSSQPTEPSEPEPKPEPEPKKPGHGRNGADDYTAAIRIQVPHPTLKPGDLCPGCEKGKVYPMTPEVVVRVVGQPPLAATIYELGKLRCNLCLEVFTAEASARAGPEKYDATAISMMAVLKYGCGVPFYRLQGLQQNLGTPLPASTQWEKVAEATPALQPAHEEMIWQAAQGEVVYNDDTTMKVLALMAENKARAKAKEEEKSNGNGKKSKRKAGKEAAEMDPDRTGIFTSGVVSTREGRKIALFFTGRKHAGENLEDVLAHRAKDLGPPIQMCDALERNQPNTFQTMLSNCLAHGRRKVAEQVEKFPDECRYLLETLAKVYKNDDYCKEEKMSDDQRLQYHQQHSGPLMEELEKWLNAQFAEHKVEPNSGLGQAISYLKDRWSRFTLFLRLPGAPLDNNIVERILKMAILHRKNSMFYKTLKGAAVGDLFMTLIHTARLNNANAFDYLTELLKHAPQVAARPADWMPWNYRLQIEPVKLEQAA